MPKYQSNKKKSMKNHKKSMKNHKKNTKGKRELNPFMTALQKARNENAPEFPYKDKIYVKKTAKTGMVIYKLKK